VFSTVKGMRLVRRKIAQGISSMLPLGAVVPLIFLMALLLSASLYGLAASGHFPREHRLPALTSISGRIILSGSIALATISLAGGIAAAWRLIPLPAAVIGGGATILAAPLVLRLFPDRIVDGRGALVTFAGASALSAMLLIWLVLAT
jgi:hypothetical protein